MNVSNHPSYQDVDPASVARVLSKVRLVDVREPHELSEELGHVTGAENVPLTRVGSEAKTWDPDQAIVVVCRSGGRSARAAALLASLGFTHVMNMRGGMQAWNDAKLPIDRG